MKKRGKDMSIVPKDKQSVMCPRCGKLLAWVNKSDNSLHKIACTNCRKWIWFRAKTKTFKVKEIPPRISASGKRFY